MNLLVRKSDISGIVEIPGSKSHTVRAVAIASLAGGKSVIRKSLISEDSLSAVKAYKKLGAKIEIGDKWIVDGFGKSPVVPDDIIDVGNSGTTLYIAMGTAALMDGCCIFTGDHQIRRRPAAPLIEALNALGARVESTRNNGIAPLIIKGPMKGGSIDLDGSKTSQYLSSLLINAPLAENDTYINVSNLVEKPYVEMTIKWLEDNGIKLENNNYEQFKISGRQKFKSFDKVIPADFSSATFFMCTAAITGSELTLTGLDSNDTQGDKKVVDFLVEMGVKADYTQEGLKIKGGKLVGTIIDLSDTPDALPSLAVTACFAEGETRLINVAQARLKETDRIKVMHDELKKMGADIEELPDGLIIRKSNLKPAKVSGHCDHRVIMSLAVAGLCIDGETVIDTAEALNVTFPDFVNLMKNIGADITLL